MSEQKLNFNEQGLLVPAEAVAADLSIIKRHFVDDFPRSKTRARLFDNLVIFNETLQNDVFPWYEQWVNGSFVTKKQHPKDVDVVVFLDYAVYDIKEPIIDSMMDTNFEKYRLDTYFVKNYPVEHSKHHLTQRTRQDWYEFFTTTRSFNKKGFIQLIFEPNS